MNLPSSSTSRRPSRLLDLIHDRARTGGTGRLGFGVRAAAPKRHLALIAGFDKVDTRGFTAAKEAGADAIEVRISSTRDLRSLAGTQEALGVPLGIVLDDIASQELATVATEVAIDWIRLPLQASVTALTWEKPARLLTLPADLEPRLAPGVNPLEIDAVVLEGGGRTPGSLSIGESLRLALLCELIKKPVIVHTNSGITPESVAVLEQFGANALLAPVEPATLAQQVAEYIVELEHMASKA